jgi:hypothetical protein
MISSISWLNFRPEISIKHPKMRDIGDQNEHREGIREHLIPSEDIRVQQHGGKMYRVSPVEGRFSSGQGEEKKEEDR